MRRIISTDQAPAAIGTYSQAVQAGDTLYISGQIPLDPATMQVVSEDFEAQAQQVFRNLAAVAEAAGTSLQSAVKLSIFLTDLSQFATVNTVMAQYFAEPYPARAAVEVSALPKGVQVEADAVLYLGGSMASRISAARTAALTPEAPLTAFPGIGEAMAARLAQLGLEVAADLLFHLPNRYEDRTRIWTIGSLAPGIRAQLVARVERADLKFGRRRSLLVWLTDGTGRLGMRLFHFSKAQQRQFVPGQWLRVYGDARPGATTLEMAHPEYTLLAGPEDAAATEDTLTPIYPLTQGVTQGRIRGLVHRALDQVLEQIPDPLASIALEADANWPKLHEAIATLHRPPVGSDVNELVSGYHPAQRRLALEELLAHRLSLSDLKQRARQRLRARPLTLNAETLSPLLDRLGFALTGAQARVIGEIANDLAQDGPMMRLVQGDVGAGKTVIAAAALLAAIQAGHQAEKG